MFDPHTRDAFERMRVNADRIFRWLDEVTKDRNLLPTNFIPSILAALPDDLRMNTLNKMMLPLGVGCRAVGGLSASTPLDLLKGMLCEAADAERAMAALVDGIDPGELETAHKELSEAITAFHKARETVENLMRGKP